MAQTVLCHCGATLDASPDLAGKAGKCPICDRSFTVPESTADAAPPQSPLQSILAALLDPQSIRWILAIGGTLVVLGLIVWLASHGVFENKITLAATLAGATLLAVAAGWCVVLRTRFRLAGQAFTFLGCVIAPLNLWFWHAQNLITLGDRLWLGGVACSLLYLTTFYVLADPLFLYAVELGVTLTVVLFLAELHLISDPGWLTLVLLALGLVSIHAERIFPPEGAFNRRRFGLPLFWSGHAQLGTGLAVLLGNQALDWLVDPAHRFLQLGWSGNWLADSYLLVTTLWLAAGYAYLYSDLVVRRSGVYTCLAGWALVMGQITLVGVHVSVEALIATLAVTAVATNLILWRWPLPTHVQRVGRPLGLALAILPLLLGAVRHFCLMGGLELLPSSAVEIFREPAGSGLAIFLAMALLAVANLFSGWLLRRGSAIWSTTYFLSSAVAAAVACSAVLHWLGATTLLDQAAWLMPLPIGYMIAARLTRGQALQPALGWAAEILAALILAGTFATCGGHWAAILQLSPGSPVVLRMGIILGEAALFYALASVVQGRVASSCLAALFACGSLWQLLGFWAVPSTWYALLHGVLGVALLAAARLGNLFTARTAERPARGGKARVAYAVGNALTTVGLLSGLMQALARLTMHQGNWSLVFSLALMVLVSLVAAGLARPGYWRRQYLAGAIATGALAFLHGSLLSVLTPWQKFEVFSVVTGLLLTIASYARLVLDTHLLTGDPKITPAANETGSAVELSPSDGTVTLGLWLGSLAAVVPLLFATCYWRMSRPAISLPDELALVTVSVLMLLAGCVGRVKATTLLGGGGLAAYLAILLVSLGWYQQWAVGVYLAAGGIVIFGLGIALSIYRDRLLEIPSQVSRREGIFQVLNWR